MKLLVITSLCLSLPLFVMSQSISNEELSEKQEKIEDYKIKIYGIIDKYPSFNYKYVYDGEEIKSVTIKGVDNKKEREDLTVYLVDLSKMKKDLFNVSNSFGVYYFAESIPVPKDGYNDLYGGISSEIEYPEEAVNDGIEGTVYVNFIVQRDGSVSVVNANSSIDKNHFSGEEMEEEAKKAIEATEGEWKPAQLGAKNVDHYMSLPIKFDLDGRPTTVEPTYLLN